MIRLAAFLGNYGKEYERTRHNAAWQFADSIPFLPQLSWQSKFFGTFAVKESERLSDLFCASGIVRTKDGRPLAPSKNAAKKIYFLKPETYMNNSGQSVAALANFYKIRPEEILVIHDELELPVGAMSLKWAGGLGGHNGLRSIRAHCGTADFWRLRFGIGKPADCADIASYVLAPFSSDERLRLETSFAQAAVLFAKLLLGADAHALLPEWKKKVIP